MQSEPSPDWSRLEPVIDALIDQLPEADRRAVILRYYEKRSHGAIGAALGLSEEAARKRLDRALEKLRELLAKRGIATSSAALATILPAHAITPAPAGLASSLSSTALSAAAITATETTIIATIMSHKAAFAGVSLLLLAGVTAVAVPKLTQEKSVAVSSSSPSSTGDAERDSGSTLPQAARSKSRSGAAPERLSAQYGDSRTKLSAHLLDEFVGMLEDSISVMEMVHKMDLGEAMAEDSEEVLGEVGKSLALNEDQKKKIAGFQVDSLHRETEKTRGLIATMRKDPSKMMEYMLMQDSVKRGETSRADLDQFKSSLDLPKESLELSIGETDKDQPLDDQAFVDAVMGILDEQQAKEFQESLSDRATTEKATGEEEPVSLEEMERSLSSGRKMIQGALQMMEGMTNSGLLKDAQKK